MKNLSKIFLILLFCLISTQCILLKTPKPSAPHYTNDYEVFLMESNSNSIEILAKYTGNETFYVDSTNPIIFNLAIRILFQSDSQLRVLIRDALESRWEIPEREPYPHDKTETNFYDVSTANYQVEVEKKPFSFKISRVLTKEVIFDTKYFNFIYTDKYLEFSSLLPTDNIFGMGERVHKLKLQIPGFYTIWNRDLPGMIDDAESGALNTYGLYPLYLMKEKKGLFHLVYLRNSNGMDIVLDNSIFNNSISGNYKEGKTITYKITGGIIDLKFFIGKKKLPEYIIKEFHEYLGKYTLQPFWSFGFHQCRWGYNNLSVLNKTLENYYSYGMPLDTIWMDIDYMVDHAIFTIDESRYNLTELEYLLKDLYHKRLVLIIDPGVAIKKNYAPYTSGIERDIFIKDFSGKPLMSCVWPGQTHFPDFMNPDTQEYWSDMFDLLYHKVKFSGIWLDMNELSNFVDGEVGIGECGMTYVEPTSKKLDRMNKTLEILLSFNGNLTENALNDSDIRKAYDKALSSLNLNFDYMTPPASVKCNYSDENFYIYNPGYTKLDQKTVCLNGNHKDSNIEYNLHNFNGFYEAINTYKYLKERLNHSQPFILSRSTTPGAGKYTIHWTGDNVSTYKWMKLSIAGLINFNIFGIPNVGADICGFASNTTEELCSRWMQLGALYPFARNHNHLESRDQDPFAFGPTLLKTSMVSLKFRYSLLKYYYSLFVRNNGTGTIMRPLFFEFPRDKKCYSDQVLDKEFLLGKELLVTPVLEQGRTLINPYFPGNNTVWYDISNGNPYKGGRNHIISSSLNETVPVFLRSGTSIFRQNVTNVNRTEDLDNVFYFSVAFNQNKNLTSAQGEILACDDYSDFSKLEKCINGDCSLKVKFTVIKKTNRKTLIINFGDGNIKNNDKIYISGVDIYGFDIESTSQTAIRKVNLVNESYYKLASHGRIEKKNNIVRLMFSVNIQIHPNDAIFVNF